MFIPFQHITDATSRGTDWTFMDSLLESSLRVMLTSDYLLIQLAFE